jgi:Kef-type K+ transport system membrane component KefB/Trk K+ transport system NAD-binding subunit
MNEFFEISLVILITTGVAFLTRFLRQPLVIGYILAGVLAGPVVLNMIHSEDTIHLFSKLGITILLFIVGLGLNPQALKEVGWRVLVGGFGQVILTASGAFIVATLLGYSFVPALYIALALTFSSTIIILKLLSDKGEIHRLYGKIALGFLVIQDLVATMALVAVSTFAAPTQQPPLEIAGLLALKSLGLGAGLYLFTKYALKPIARWTAKSQELLYLFSISWGLGLAGLFAAAGFSVEIGALVAGITLSSTAYATEISSRLKPLRDFFVLLFFVLLGSQINPNSALHILPQAIFLSAFVLAGGPIIIILVMRRLGYRPRTSFQTGIALAQISEFSLILAALGLSVGHLDESVVSLITVVGLITIAVSTYLIIYADKLYPHIHRYLKLFGNHTNHEPAPSAQRAHDAVLFGFNRVGVDFVRALRSRGLSPLVIDYDPRAVERLAKHDLAHRYGDATDVEFLLSLEFEQVKMVVSTLPDFESNLLILRTARKHNPDSVIITLAHDTKEALKLYRQGATYVLMPHYIGAQYAASMIREHGADHRAYRKRKEEHLISLQQRIEGDIIGTVVEDLASDSRPMRAKG